MVLLTLAMTFYLLVEGEGRGDRVKVAGKEDQAQQQEHADEQHALGFMLISIEFFLGRVCNVRLVGVIDVFLSELLNARPGYSPLVNDQCRRRKIGGESDDRRHQR